jgi:hypothetical protein
VVSGEWSKADMVFHRGVKMYKVKTLAGEVFTTHHSPLTTHQVPRKAFSILEMEVALVLFGISIAGLCPLVVMQARQLKSLQSRLSPQTTYYLVPSSDAWTRKLGAGASLVTQPPGSSGSGSPPNLANTVTIQSLTKSLTSEAATAQVLVQPN